MTEPRPRLLLVDDEPDILVALQDLFEEDFEVATSTRPEQALALLADGLAPDLIISDQRMPGLAGDAFLARAREYGDHEALLLTGYADLGAVSRALNQGGIAGYQTKPWDPEALRAMALQAAERRRLRRALARQQALFDAMMASTPDAVSFKNVEGRLIALNEVKGRLLRLQPAQALGRSEADITGSGIAPEERSALADGVPRRRLQETEADGRWAASEIRYIPLAGPEAALLVIEQDVTAEREAEQRRRQAEKLQALGTLAGGVAHDFNNLLTAILGNLELAQRRRDDPAQVERFQEGAIQAANRAAALTRRLLDFSRSQETEPVQIDTGAALASARELVLRGLDRCELVWETEEALWPVTAEPDQLEVALLNLCVNARDALGDAPGQIRVSASNVSLDEEAAGGLPAGDYVVVRVEDDGAGFPEVLLDRVLEPFFTTKPPGQGTGLGLSMVYGFAQRSGGALRLANGPRGAEVTLYLPRASNAVLPEPDREIRPDRRRGRRILLIDDDPDVRTVTRSLLEELGHEVIEAGGGAGAIALVDHGVRADLALIDFAMPGLNGLEVAQALQEKGFAGRCILLTGHHGLDAPPQDVPMINKPPSLEALERALRQVMEPPEIAPA